jgi:hypothetical protein
LGINGCQEEEEETVDTVVTTSVSNIGPTTAMAGGSVINISGNYIQAKGIVWNTRSSPTVHLSTKTIDNTYENSFTNLLTGLSPETEYFVRAYATTSMGTTYGQEEIFYTLPAGIPIVNTEIYQCLESIAYGQVGLVDNGGSPITEIGLVWSTDHSPTALLSTKISNCRDDWMKYFCQIEGLIPSTTYYVRGYATNYFGTGYGQELEMVTLDPGLPSVQTYIPVGIGSAVATGRGEVHSDHGSPLIEQGMVWSTSSEPTISLSTKTIANAGIGKFNSTLTELSPSTVYYVRAYATNELGTAYGNEVTFTTPAANKLTVITTFDILVGYGEGPFGGGNIRWIIIDARGSIPDDGGSLVTSRGLAWGTSSSSITNYVPAESPYESYGAGEYSIPLGKYITPGQRYYVKAYATNAFGTVYGETKSAYYPN